MQGAFRWLLLTTAVFGLGLGLAFGGGVLYGRNTAKAAPAAAVVTVPAGGGAAFGGGGAGAAGTAGAGGAQAGGQGGGQQRGGAGGGLTAGVIEKIEGNTITLRTQQGSASVAFTSDTTVRQTVGAQAADLKTGQTVTVTGAAGSDGKVNAQSITIAPAGAGTGGQGGGPGGQGGAAPAATPAGTTRP